MHTVRTTITLDPDVEALVKRTMRDRGLTFKQVVNEGLRRGMSAPRASGEPFPFPTYDLGEPAIDLVKALRLAGELEDAEIAAKLARGV